jgi:hypothetical protein
VSLLPTFLISGFFIIIFFHFYLKILDLRILSFNKNCDFYRFFFQFLFFPCITEKCVGNARLRVLLAGESGGSGPLHPTLFLQEGGDTREVGPSDGRKLQRGQHDHYHHGLAARDDPPTNRKKKKGSKKEKKKKLTIVNKIIGSFCHTKLAV